MEQNTHPEERKVTDWRSYNGRSGRAAWGLIVSGIGGFWLVTNLTNHASLIAQNPGRVVFPALVIVIGIATIFTRRESRPRNTN